MSSTNYGVLESSFSYTFALSKTNCSCQCTFYIWVCWLYLWSFVSSCIWAESAFDVEERSIHFSLVSLWTREVAGCSQQLEVVVLKEIEWKCAKNHCSERLLKFTKFFKEDFLSSCCFSYGINSRNKQASSGTLKLCQCCGFNLLSVFLFGSYILSSSEALYWNSLGLEFDLYSICSSRWSFRCTDLNSRNVDESV